MANLFHVWQIIIVVPKWRLYWTNDFTIWSHLSWLQVKLRQWHTVSICRRRQMNKLDRRLQHYFYIKYIHDKSERTVDGGKLHADLPRKAFCVSSLFLPKNNWQLLTFGAFFNHLERERVKNLISNFLNTSWLIVEATKFQKKSTLS